MLIVDVHACQSLLLWLCVTPSLQMAVLKMSAVMQTFVPHPCAVLVRVLAKLVGVSWAEKLYILVADAPRVSTEQRAAALPSIPEHSRYEQLCTKLDALNMQQGAMSMQQEIMSNKQDLISSKQDQLMVGTQVASVLARRIVRWTASHGSSADLRPDNAPFKRRLVQHYFPSHTEEQCTYQCMVTGRWHICGRH